MRSLIGRLVSPRAIVGGMGSVLHRISSSCRGRRRTFVRTYAVFISNVSSSVDVDAGACLRTLSTRVTSSFVFIVKHKFGLGLSVRGGPIGTLTLGLSCRSLRRREGVRVVPTSEGTDGVACTFLRRLETSRQSGLSLLANVSDCCGCLEAVKCGITRCCNFLLTSRLLPRLVPNCYTSDICMSACNLVLRGSVNIGISYLGWGGGLVLHYAFARLLILCVESERPKCPILCARFLLYLRLPYNS